jgi:hypothetical protein
MYPSMETSRLFGGTTKIREIGPSPALLPCLTFLPSDQNVSMELTYDPYVTATCKMVPGASSNSVPPMPPAPADVNILGATNERFLCFSFIYSLQIIIANANARTHCGELPRGPDGSQDQRSPYAELLKRRDLRAHFEATPILQIIYVRLLKSVPRPGEPPGWYHKTTSGSLTFRCFLLRQPTLLLVF